MSVEVLEGGRRIFNSPRLSKMRVELLTHLATHLDEAPNKIVREYLKALEMEIIHHDSRGWQEFSETSWDQWDRRQP